ncbi:MAG: universal stress protein [Lautropia sp.]
MKILLSVDGSPYTKRMLEYVVAHPTFLGTHHEYTIMHVVPQLPVRAAAAFDKAGLAKHYAEEAEEALGPIRAFCRTNGLNATYVIEHGTAGDVIANRADGGGFDLLVMGSHGHGSFANLVMGSVATRVLAHCKVPVLLVR